MISCWHSPPEPALSYDNPYGALSPSNIYETINLPSLTPCDPASDARDRDGYSHLQHSNVTQGSDIDVRVRN